MFSEKHPFRKIDPLNYATVIPTKERAMSCNHPGNRRSRPPSRSVLLALLLFLLPQSSPCEPFVWNSDALFEQLEQEFLQARKLSAPAAEERFHSLEQTGNVLLGQFDPAATTLPDTLLTELEKVQFDMGAIAAAHPELLQRLHTFANRLRQRILPASRQWKADTTTIQNALYRLIYGGRATVEEAWLQSETETLPSLLQLKDAPASTPSTIIEGVRVHSGDILLSRAGAPTSALISRGNDYRGNFSHIALLYVDAETKEPAIIESHIERGVVISSVRDYFEDTKQRIVVLRLRSDHPKLMGNPRLPHDAARAMFVRANKSRIPYDFAMDYEDDRSLFCAEVAYHAYRQQGIELWQTKTEMTAPGLRAWLADMGVRHFRTLAPSDIEYDSQLDAVAEWRDMEVLREDRLDNAAMDALLEEAEKGLRLSYPVYKYPLAAGVKLWGNARKLLGMEPTIPKGMQVSTALKVNSLVEKVFPLLRQRLRQAASTFRKEHGYAAPYWSLTQLARRILRQSLPELSSQLVRESGH